MPGWQEQKKNEPKRVYRRHGYAAFIEGSAACTETSKESVSHQRQRLTTAVFSEEA